LDLAIRVQILDPEPFQDIVDCRLPIANLQFVFGLWFFSQVFPKTRYCRSELIGNRQLAIANDLVRATTLIGHAASLRN
jgi:hypothetical protein